MVGTVMLSNPATVNPDWYTPDDYDRIQESFNTSELQRKQSRIERLFPHLSPVTPKYDILLLRRKI